MAETEGTANETKAYLLRLDRNWNFIDLCEVNIDDSKRIIGAFTRENELLIFVANSDASNILGTLSSGQQVFEVYTVIM